MKKGLILLGLFILLSGGTYLFLEQNEIRPAVLPPKEAVNTTNLPLKIADIYNISIFAEDLGNPRDLEVDPDGTLVVSLTSQGRVVTLPDKKVVAQNLNRPHGIAFADNKIYIAETNQVAVYDYDLNTKITTNKRKIIDLPAGGNHFTRSILIKNNKIYVSIGSSCNVCEERDERRAAIWFANLDGSDFKPFAQGLRNSVFMTLHSQTNEIWATDMGRDLIGDDLPPEEINIIKESKFYGWPYCYGKQATDQKTNSNNAKYNCADSVPAHITFQAHSAPLGLAFLGNDLLVAYHGSWNRSILTGYKVVKFSLDKNGNPVGEPTDFITGWLQGNEALGRPADILIKNEDEIYISDDKKGVVYLVEDTQ